MKCEKTLQNAQRSNCSKNPESLNNAVHWITRSNPFSNVFHGVVGFEEQHNFGSQALINNAQGTLNLSLIRKGPLAVE